MRHSTITLTMDRYTHLGVRDERAALDRLPDIGTRPQDDTEARQATGTDDFSGSVLTSTETGTGRHGVSSRITGQVADEGASTEEEQR